MALDAQAVIIDSGSHTCKVGLGLEAAPNAMFRSIVGLIKCCGMPYLYKDHYIGEEALQKCGILILRTPLNQGVITNWDDLEKLWMHAFYTELKVPPEEHPVILTQSLRNSKYNREKTVQVLFETFSVPALYLAVPEVMVLIATGRETGIVLDCGHTGVNCLPVSSLSPLPYALLSSPIAGKSLTEYLTSMITQRWDFFTVKKDDSLVTHMKEQLCYVALDCASELRKALTASYELPDGNALSLCAERCCPEALFQPGLLNDETPGLDELLLQAINRCSCDIRGSLYRNIVVSGGSSLFPGFTERLTKEVESKTSETVSITAPMERKYLPWVGCSVLSGLSSFQSLCVTQADYEEVGPSIIHRKGL